MQIEELNRIAKTAGLEIMEVYADPSQFETELKADDSPLTLADRRSNAVIIRGLQALNLGYHIVSEEVSESLAYDIRKGDEYIWLVDPLDGTKEFIKRNGEFTVNIGLVRNGEPWAGFVYVPVTETSYWAVRGEGAWKEKSGVKEKLECGTFHINDKGLRVVSSRSHLNPATEAFVDALSEPDLVPRGSSLKFIIIAEGGADIYPRLAPTMEWDTAAAHCILQEAGGIVMRADNEEPLRYNKQNLLNPHFVAFGDVEGLAGFRY
jgi:3'(2'), 5'-bisphosphate nucleotidase